MIPKLSSRVSSFLLINNIIVGEDEEVYQYSLEVLLSTIINFIVIVLVAFLTGTISETTLYLIGFIPLRMTAGGYHARTHFRCFLTLMCTYLFFVLIVKFLPEVYFIIIIFLSGMIALHRNVKRVTALQPLVHQVI